jgi:hypothetical protein
MHVVFPFTRSLQLCEENLKKRRRRRRCGCMKCGTERENRHVTRHDRARTQNTNREEEKKKKGWVDSLFFSAGRTKKEKNRDEEEKRVK